MKLINTITKKIHHVDNDTAESWIKSSTPWMSFDTYCARGIGKTGMPAYPELKVVGDPVTIDTPPPSTLLQNILDWTQTLPNWLSDAARRLFENESVLTDQDYQELYALMKTETGISDQNELVPVPLSKDHLPAVLAPGSAVVLKSMGELNNVNKISPDQTLEFMSNGMTVVYGGNGSGKSGYARVLKKACRARDQSEPIHPDASDEAAATKVPTGKFEIEMQGNSQTIHWSRDQVSPEPLSTITVFDTRCARSILTGEHDVAYLPYGLDIVESLANKVIPQIKSLLDDEMDKLNIDATPFAHLQGKTQVGAMITGLGPQTKPDDIKKLGTLSTEETNRLSELNAVLANADPLVKAEELRLSKERLKKLAADINKPLVWVSDAAVEKLKGLTEDKIAAEMADKAAAETLQAGEELLPGTGAEVWKAFFEAAKRFSMEEAFKGRDFPSEETDQTCPLCQQSLTEEAKNRLTRFNDYVKADVSLQAKEKQQALSAAVTKIGDASLQVKMSSSLSDEISLLDAELPPRISGFENSVQQRRASMLNAVTSNDWQSITPLQANPKADIRRLAAKQLRTARNYMRASDPETKRKLEQERAELSARLELSKVVTPLLTILGNIKTKDALGKCQRSLNTRPISDKSKELASKAVSEELRAALEKELKALGIDHIGTVLKSRINRGQMLHKLVLNVPTKTKIDEILSEGEQRAIALASFFAELATANHTGGIIFDDPVSSLDHWRRINVAKRLVEESSKRQVIVFTHDTSFLGQLRDELDENATNHRLMYLERDRDSVGYVREGLPWGHQDYKERLTSLEARQQDLSGRWSPYPSEDLTRQLRHLYSDLRATVERVIQDVVFNGVVARYRDWVKVNKLKSVIGFSISEHDDIARIYKRCCDVIDSHDPSSDRGISLPSASDLGSDIQELRQLIANIKQRRRSN